MAERADLKSVQYWFESNGGDMAKRRKVDVPIVEYKEGEEKYAMFGWCGTGQHKQCRVVLLISVEALVDH